MKTFKIEVSGKSLSNVIAAIEEVARLIDEENICGANRNEDGDFSFFSEGDYDDYIPDVDAMGFTPGDLNREG